MPELTPELRMLGRVAYDAWAKSFARATSTTSVPEWIDLSDIDRNAWGASVVAVADHFKARTSDVFYGYARL